MNQWIGENTRGDWVLDCRDYSNAAVGTLNEWRLKLIYEQALPQASPTWSGVKMLYR